MRRKYENGENAEEKIMIIRKKKSCKKKQTKKMNELVKIS